MLNYLKIKSGVLLTWFISILLSGAILSGVAVTNAQAYGYRYHHYPSYGGYISVLPRYHHSFYYGGIRYYYAGGVWYRPWGPRFIVVAPPLGFVIPFLPPSYGTVWVGGVPYYYANETYYMQTQNGYMVVNPPQGSAAPDAAAAAPQGTDQVYIYPRQGQGEKQQADDRYACHRWAADQTRYDPTKLSGPPDPQKHSEYQRAMGACLEGRGYTVK